MADEKDERSPEEIAAEEEMLKFAGMEDDQIEVADAKFQEFNDKEVEKAQRISSSGNERIDMLMDIVLPVSIELGRTKMFIKDILELERGSIVEIDKLAGEPVDILVNHKLIAKGEVVVIDENFGVRVTEIINSLERANIT